MNNTDKVNPEAYQSALRFVEDRDSLPRSFFVPAQMAEIFAIEEELNEALPPLYEEHLLRLGSGEEFGGLSRWLHIDLARSGNILEEQTPDGFLPIYDSCEGELFGYYRNGKPFSEEIYLWEGSGKAEPYLPSLAQFYLDRLDCSEEELLTLEKK